MRGSIVPAVHREVDGQHYSLPINKQHKNTVSFVASHVGMMMAYSSGRDIVILVEAQQIKDILHGHDQEICALSFELKGPHLVSCDVGKNCIFWHYQDSSWKITRTITLSNPAICFSWCAARRIISIATKKGLYFGNVLDIETNHTRLAAKSVFCSFNHDGSLLASHNESKALSIYKYIGEEIVTQIIKVPKKICIFEFHPTEIMFMVITIDGVLRIFTVNSQDIFGCTTVIRVPIPGRFVRPPAIFPSKKPITTDQRQKIVFLTKEGKQIKLTIDGNGKIITRKPSSKFNKIKSDSIVDSHKLMAVFKTNRGVEAISVDDDGISIVSDQYHKFLFHSSKIVDARFSPNGDLFYSRDANRTLIFWAFMNPYIRSRVLSNQADAAAWLNDSYILVLSDGKLAQINPLTMESFEYQFPYLVDVVQLYVRNDVIYALCKDKIVTREKIIHIPTFDYYSFSFNFEDKVLFLSSSKSVLKAIILPDGVPVDISDGIQNVNGIACITISSFAVLSNPFILIYEFNNSKFEISHKFELAQMDGIASDQSPLGGRLFVFDRRRVYLVENAVVPYCEMENPSRVAASRSGHFIAIAGCSMQLYPAWVSDTTNIMQRETANTTGRKDASLVVGRMTADARFLISLTSLNLKNFIPSPSCIIKPHESVVRTVETTFTHLLEFQAIGHLEDFHPKQIPAIPAQYAFPSGFVLEEGSSEEHQKLLKIVRDIEGDIDMFGVRYLAAVHESNWPPSFTALWLSYSNSQSQIAECISSSLNVNNITKYYIALGIRSQSMLEDLVRQSLRNMWASIKKVDPVALLYSALGEVKYISKLYNIIGDNQRSDFFKKDFRNDRNRRSALKNAYSSLSNHNFEMCATLFIVAGDAKSAIQVIRDKFNDPILAFLVIRLLEKRLNGELMKWFLDDIIWNDKVIPVLIKALKDKNSIANELKELLLEDQYSSNVTSMGDKRIAIYQIYHRLTGDSSIVRKVARNLTNDGLIPLAKYILALPREKNVIQKMVEEAPDQNTDIGNEEEEKESLFSQESLNVESDDDFDFGGGGFDSGWDSEDYSEDSESSSNSTTVEKGEENNNEKEENDFMNNIKNNTDDIFTRHQDFVIEQLSKFFATVEIKDDTLGWYAIHYGYGYVGYPKLSDKEKRVYDSLLSHFIDFCGARYLESGEIPATNKRLLELCSQLARSIVPDFGYKFSLKEIQSIPNNGFAHSIFFGAFVVAAWSFLPRFVNQLLDENVKPIEFPPSKLPTPCSPLNADISSPRFPDTLPHLVVAFTRSDIFHATNIEAARFMVMFLVLERFLKIANEFGVDDFHELLASRRRMLIKTIELYQTAQGCPLVQSPFYSGREPLTLLSVIKEERDLCEDILQTAHAKALRKAEYPSIFRNGRLAVGDVCKLRVKEPSIDSICICSTDPDLIAVAANGYLRILSIGNGTEIPVQASKNDFGFVVEHPMFHFFLAISPSLALLVGFDGSILDQQFELPGDRIVRAAFSPRGDRLAVCTSSAVYIFTLDLGESLLKHSFEARIDGLPRAMVWLNEDTTVAIAVDGPDFCYISVVDTIGIQTGCISMERDWGVVSCMYFEPVRCDLIVGTENGYTVVLSESCGFETVCVHEHGDSVGCLAGVCEVCVSITRSGQISAFSTGHLGKVDTKRVDAPVSCVCAREDLIVCGGDGSCISVWRSV